MAAPGNRNSPSSPLSINLFFFIEIFQLNLRGTIQLLIYFHSSLFVTQFLLRLEHDCDFFFRCCFLSCCFLASLYLFNSVLFLLFHVPFLLLLPGPGSSSLAGTKQVCNKGRWGPRTRAVDLIKLLPILKEERIHLHCVCVPMFAACLFVFLMFVFLFVSHEGLFSFVFYS